MARPLEFDRQHALDAATAVIWERGFKSASLTELADTMGLNKSSIYNSFGNKQDVLLSVVDNYLAAQLRELERLFVDQGFRAGITSLFHDIADCNNEGRGCLLVNCTAELASHDADVAARVRKGFDAIAASFERHALLAQAAGKLDPAIAVDALSKALVAFVSGMRVMAKAGVDHSTLIGIINSTLSFLMPEGI